MINPNTVTFDVKVYNKGRYSHNATIALWQIADHNREAFLNGMQVHFKGDASVALI